MCLIPPISGLSLKIMEICTLSDAMMQEVFIYLALGCALFFLGKRIYAMMTHKKTPGCADCAAVEPKKKINLTLL